jgi:ketosteroid isomerase-like protein
MKGRACIFALLLTVVVSASGPVDSTPLYSGDLSEARDVRNEFEIWQKAFAAGDLEGSMRIFDPGVVFAFQGQRDQSYADLRAGYAKDFASRRPGAGERWVPTIEEIYAEGRTAFVRSTWEGRLDTAQGVKVTARNRSIDLLRRGDDGYWRIFRSLNYPEKPA